jgi:chorismate dehydratase
MRTPVRVGLFPYLNVQPLIAGLRHEKDCEIVIDVPSRIADRFRAGELDLAMVPSFEAATLGARVLDSICIASDGPVETVLLHHRVPLSEVKTLGLDVASRTSAALAKILVAEESGRLPETRLLSPFEPEAASADAFLIIGDPAFNHVRPGFDRLDLGEEWRRRRALPFVFAVMVGSDHGLQTGVSARMRDALARGLEEAPAIAASYTSGVGPARAVRYLRSVIRYDLGRREKEGLACFYRLAQNVGLLNEAKELQFHAL